jgi:hypothetical protein
VRQQDRRRERLTRERIDLVEVPQDPRRRPASGPEVHDANGRRTFRPSPRKPRKIIRMRRHVISDPVPPRTPGTPLGLNDLD